MGNDNMVKRKFAPLFEGLSDERFNWHALRHFAVSSWIEAGLNRACSARKLDGTQMAHGRASIVENIHEKATLLTGS
jgi:hypothetical protein